MPVNREKGEGKEKQGKKPAAPLRPSSSIILLSPTNQVLLLHRVQTSSSFASAHVFPGGNVSSFHDGPLPPPDDPAIHLDGPAYRLAAIRETFEESGILLAKKQGRSGEQGLLHLPDDVREEGRKQIHGNAIRFTEWLASHGGEPDVENLIPFTRWITPPGPPKRFTTQMYLYMLPLDLPQQHGPALIPTPTPDGGVEHTAAAFDDAAAWLARARAGDIVLFPPQFYLLHLPSAPSCSPSCGARRPQQQRRRRAGGDRAGTRMIAWADKAISPAVLFARRRDGRVVLGLDKPGPELRGSGRGGDWERVVLVDFRGGVPRDVDVRAREEVLREERESAEREGGGDREGEGEKAKL
ncbi:hypothetical protein VTH06DRAFT_2368 [Thermothelomyces fergusii]